MAPANECKLLSLPKELRDMIWETVAEDDEDLILTTYWEETSERPPLEQLSIISLQWVSRQVRDEALWFFNECIRTPTLNFNMVPDPLEALIFSLNPPYEKRREPRGLRALFRRLNATLVHALVHYHRRSESQYNMGPMLYCSAAHLDRWSRLDNEFHELNDLHHFVWKRIAVGSLEFPAGTIFTPRLMRRLRRLREVGLHFTFIPDEEAIRVEDLLPGPGISDRRWDGFKGKIEPIERVAPPNIKWRWLGENAATDLVLPIYDSPEALLPIAIAPLARLTDAIRREVAVREQAPISAGQAMRDPPIWIEFHPDDPAHGDLRAPESGWYRYLARDPGVCCLEQTNIPMTPLPRTRRSRRRARQELGRLGLPKPKPMFQYERRLELERMNIHGLVFKGWPKKRAGCDGKDISETATSANGAVSG